jgi:class 3 adenylate cyclase
MVKCPHCGEQVPDRFRLCGYCGAPLPSASATLPAHEVRKTVTIVFCDLKDSTALAERIDAEALYEVKERYFRAMVAEIERHGGKVEKYIGDAIMAVFGLPRAHEDDALRAVRAVAGMQAALSRVNEILRREYGVALANRIGVNTGEVLATDDSGSDQRLVTGDAVNVAARLEQAAPADNAYLGETTYRLVAGAVEAERVEPLELKGKSQRVAAWRLIRVQGMEGNGRHSDTPLVGREEELAALAQAWRAACDGRAARLVTIVGDAGVGKSRLAHEAVERMAPGARVVRGRCLPYGDGITFWPLVGMVNEAAGISAGDSPDAACDKLLQLVGDPALAQRLASTVGLNSGAIPAAGAVLGRTQVSRASGARHAAGGLGRRHPLGRAPHSWT